MRRVIWGVPETLHQKPNDRNLRVCPQCFRQKLQFPTEQSARLHLEYNSDEIYRENGKAPVRIYWCSACCCYHTTSKPSVTLSDADQERSEILEILGSYMIDKTENSKVLLRSAYERLLENQDKPWSQEIARKILMCIGMKEKESQE